MENSGTEPVRSLGLGHGLLSLVNQPGQLLHPLPLGESPLNIFPIVLPSGRLFLIHFPPQLHLRTVFGRITFHRNPQALNPASCLGLDVQE